jgi:hypothetical protein
MSLGRGCMGEPSGVAIGGQSPADGTVIGWVRGTPVLLSALDPYIAKLAAGPVGTRLGLGDEVGTPAGPGGSTPDGSPAGPAGPDSSRADALRTWGTKALLVDTLMQAEAARLGVTDPTSPAQWLARLEAAGELPDQKPTEGEVKAYFSANRHRFRVSEARRVRHVLVADEESARRLQEQAADADSLARLAAGTSLDQGSRDRAGDLGWVERGHLAGALEDAIFAAEPHRVIGPVPSPFGWHVLVVEAVRRARHRAFRECRTEVEGELTEYRRRRAWLDWLDRRVAEAISVPAGAEHPLFRGLPGSSHRH